MLGRWQERLQLHYIKIQPEPKKGLKSLVESRKFANRKYFTSCGLNTTSTSDKLEIDVKSLVLTPRLSQVFGSQSSANRFEVDSQLSYFEPSQLQL